MNNKIDIIVTWVDMNDPAWRADYNYWRAFEIDNGIQSASNSQAFGTERTRDWGLFPFWFRAVEQNCPWVNKVFLICQRESQLPKWLNRKSDKLQIVYHDEFIPAEFLPTFNIMTIEMFIHRIAGLSNNFISCNDDFYFMKPIPENLFFIDNIPVDRYIYKTYTTTPKINTVFDNILKNKDDLVYRLSDGKFNFGFHHLQYARKKDYETEFYAKHKDLIDASLIKSKFRHKDNQIAWLYQDMMKVDGITIDKDIYKNSKCFHLRNANCVQEFDRYDMIAVNDNEFIADFNTTQQTVFKFFKNKFSKKSQFELYDSTPAITAAPTKKPAPNKTANKKYYLYF